MVTDVLRYLEEGLSIIPAHPINKTPLVDSWTAFQKDKPTVQQVGTWFANGDKSPAIITGAVSGGLEVLDFDEYARQYPQWFDLVMEQAPGLVDNLVQQTTQNGGIHMVYRCIEVPIPGNKKLSSGAVVVPGPGMHTHCGKEYKAFEYRGKWIIAPTLIETRGEGGYFLASPGKGYELVTGSLTQIPIISAQERRILHECAEILTEYHRETPAHQNGYKPQNGDRPGDVYDRDVAIQELLSQDGWRNTGRKKHLPDGTEAELWARPGKQRGVSATVYDNKVHVFTSNATPLIERVTYGPFAYLAVTQFNGDFSAAAREIASASVSKRQQASAEISKGDISSANDTPCQRSVSASANASANDVAIGRLIRDYVLDNEGEFSTFDIDREFSILTRQDKNSRSSALLRLVKECKIKKVKGKVGRYKIVTGQLEGMKLGAQQSEPLDIPLPLGLGDLAALVPGNIVLVAGAPNSGKTAFMLTLAFNLLKKEKEKRSKKEKERKDSLTLSDLVSNGVAYFNSEMDEAELTNRCLLYPDGYEIFSSGCRFFQRFRNFADVIVPNGINFIDFLEIHEDFFELGKLINEIHEELTGGLCFIAVQKKQGADFAKGGSASLEKPRLALNIDRNDQFGNICKIVKCKRAKKAGDNHDGKECDFGVRGHELVRYSTWRYVNPKQREMYNRDYEKGMPEPIPDKNYAFILNLADGAKGRITEEQVDQWEREMIGVKVREELRRIDSDSRRKPFLEKKDWFFKVPALLRKNATVPF